MQCDYYLPFLFFGSAIDDCELGFFGGSCFGTHGYGVAIVGVPKM